SRKKGDLANGLAIRLNQEHADKMWIIKTVSKKEEAIFYEQFLSIKYGIPTIVFNAYTNNKDTESRVKQAFCDKMFEEIDTENNVLKLMSDYNIFEEYPHHQPKAVIRGQSARRFINLDFFAGRQTGKDKGWHSHRISLNTSGDKIKNNLKKFFSVRNGNKNTWRIETERAEYDEAEKFAKKILSFYDFDLLIKAKLTKNKSFYAMPFSHLKPFMTIPLLQNGKIIEDEIKAVSYSDYDGFVYDISVCDFRQFAANGMIVHNSVYSWRGADINNILDFEKDYPGAKSVKLEQNYRSTPKILNTAWQVVQNNDSRIDKRLWTQNTDDGSVSVLKTSNENDEAAKVANIISIKSANGVSLSDCAVFYRTNAQSRVFEDAFRRADIPYAVIGTLRFYDRAEIKNIMAYLKLIHNPNDNVSFKRIINVPKRGIGKTSMENLEAESIKRNLSIWQTIPFIKEININRNAAAAIEDFVVLIKGFMSLKETESVKSIVEKVISHSGYLKELELENSAESQTKIENIKELITAVEDFENRSPDKTLSGYLTQISLVSDMDSYDDSKGKAVLMTLHLAKGLEFENVFICGLEEGLFPIGETSFFPQDLEEERRLMYVGMTRAKKHLYLCWATERMLYGKTKWNLLSRFVIEAGFKDDFAAENKTQKSGDFHFNRLPKKIWSPESPNPSNRKSGFAATATIDYIPSDDEIIQDEPKDDSPYQIGKMVSHQVFGTGKIIDKLGSSNDLKLVVLFENGQWKKLLAKVANLKII
ncbi:MAG: ATP-binding domain-containing protein, partial [Endomicrobium sp.]|nr:ATP-binding domain-containing protein [Endomicrobium sp.]